MVKTKIPVLGEEVQVLVSIREDALVLLTFQNTGNNFLEILMKIWTQLLSQKRQNHLLKCLHPAPKLPSHTLFQLMASLIIRPAFISPTKHQPEKLGHQKSRDKKEGCKQQ
ncbi:unnamed protein product [Natator depressus]